LKEMSHECSALPSSPSMTYFWCDKGNSIEKARR
jgi:hypothetical protein